MRLFDKPKEKFALRVAVRSAINDLPEKYRSVIEGAMEQFEVGEEINLHKIGMQLNCPYATLHGRFAKALLLLRRQLKDEPAVQEWLETTHRKESFV